MTPNQVRKLALALPSASEQPHFDKASFRVNGKIFATLWEKERKAVLKLTRDEQDTFVQAMPDVFGITPWGLNGWTSVELARVDAKLFEKLLRDAWSRVAPKKLVAGAAGPRSRPAPDQGPKVRRRRSPPA